MGNWLKSIGDLAFKTIPGGSLASAGLSALGTLFGKSQDLKNSKAMADYNNQLAQQNMQLQQQYNERNMQLQEESALRQFSKQFELQNQRQDELNRGAMVTQVQAMKDAGLNPAMLSGGEFSGNVASPSGGMPSSSAPIGSPMGSLANSGMNPFEFSMNKEQLEGVKANNQVLKEQANLLRVEAEGKSKDNFYKDDWWNNSLLLQKSEIKFNDKRSSKIEADILEGLDRLQLDIDKNEQEIAESVARIERMATEEGLLESQTFTEDLNRQWLPRVLGARVALDYSHKRLNDWEASQSWANIQEVTQRIRNLKSELNLTDAQVDVQLQNAIRAKLENESLEKIPPAVRYCVDKVFGLFDIAGILYGVRSATKPKTKRVRTRTDKFQQSNGDIGTITTEVTDYH